MGSAATAWKPLIPLLQLHLIVKLSKIPSVRLLLKVCQQKLLHYARLMVSRNTQSKAGKLLVTVSLVSESKMLVMPTRPQRARQLW